MTDNNTVGTSVPPQPAPGESLVVRIPKPNMQVAVLGIVAIITVFQSVQLWRMSRASSTAPAIAPAVLSANTSGEGSGGGSAADVPQSMVGGC